MEQSLKRMPLSTSLTALLISGGISGMLSITSYLTIAFSDLPDPVVFFLAMAFPILGIVFLFSLTEYIHFHEASYANRLGFVFGSLAFTICAAFLAAQLAVQIGVNIKSDQVGAAEARFVKESIRLIDMGMDVAWDMFIGTYLVLFLISARKLIELKFWGFTLGILGIALMILNTITFPNPPAEVDLFDLGPFIALGLFGLAGQTFRLGITAYAENRAKAKRIDARLL
ncbi:hypothetical protein LXM25_09110 [Dyadobacter sp. LJ53]|uniref:hypothetical protein n=1 Tax=Dyadobacter chenwenxiniae TaxID=2906456 RepID=UPI001F1D6573|nr:hypothetical protein [Dyadobacter chenwenxiniae]MCF0050214.1 hypothetical protein [Dyadobacter chenwenxiniae]